MNEILRIKKKQKYSTNETFFAFFRIKSQKLKNFYSKKVKPNLQNFKKKLAPFLIDEKKVYYLDIFENLISKEIER